MTATQTREPRSSRFTRTHPAKRADVPAPKALPKTNLLPQKYVKAAEKRARLTQLVTAVVSAAALLAVLFLAQSGQIALANSNLTQVQGQLSTVTAQANDPSLTGAAEFYAEVSSMVDTARTAMAPEVLYSHLITALSADTPSGISWATVAINTNNPNAASTNSTTSPTSSSTGTATAASCPGGDPFHTAPTIGCVNFTGTASTGSQVNDLLSRLTKDRAVFVTPFISQTGSGSSTGSGGKTSFTGTVNITPKVMSNRYANPKFFGGAVSGSTSGGSNSAPTPATAAATTSSSSGFPMTYLLAAVLAIGLLGLLVMRSKQSKSAKNKKKKKK